MGRNETHITVELLVRPDCHWHAVWALWSTQAAPIPHVVVIAWSEPTPIRVDTVRALLQMSMARMVAEWHTACLSAIWSDSEAESLRTHVIIDLLSLLLRLLLVFVCLLLFGLLIWDHLGKGCCQMGLLPF